MVYGGEWGCAVGGLEGRLGMDGVKVTCYFPSPAVRMKLFWEIVWRCPPAALTSVAAHSWPTNSKAVLSIPL